MFPLLNQFSLKWYLNLPNYFTFNNFSHFLPQFDDLVISAAVKVYGVWRNPLKQLVKLLGPEKQTFGKSFIFVVVLSVWLTGCSSA